MIPRYAKRRDENEADIVKDLRKCGYLVRQQDFPDLLVRHPSWPASVVQLLEIQGITKNRKRDDKQLEFLSTWGIPIAKSFEDAEVLLRSLNAVLQSRLTSASCLSKLPGVITTSVAVR